MGGAWRAAPLLIVAVGLFVVVWRTPHSLAGEAAEAILSALSCVTLGVLLGSVTPHRWLKAGIVAMSAADVWLVSTQLLQHPNSELAAAAPGAGLPQLQSEQFGSVTMGYGDLFVAGLLGAIYAGDRRLQLWAAALTFVIACLFDLLFFVVNDLPATVPVALALCVLEIRPLRRWISRRGADRRTGPGREDSVFVAAGRGRRPRLLGQRCDREVPARRLLKTSVASSAERA